MKLIQAVQSNGLYLLKQASICAKAEVLSP